MVIIRQNIPIDYENQQDGRLARSLSTAADVGIVVRQGDTLSGIISDRYRVGMSNAPQAYKVFEGYILAQNALRSPLELKADSRIFVPQVPRIALKYFNPEKPLFQLPKFAISSQLFPRSQALNPDGPLLRLEEAFRAGAQEAVVYRGEDRKRAEEVLAADPTATVESAPITISFQAAAAASSNGDLLSPADAQIVRKALSDVPKQRPVLLVLDDSWPTDESFRKSRDFFEEALAKVRTKYKFRDAEFSARLRSAVGATWTSTKPIGQRHSQSIEASLASLRALEPEEGRVRVIYLPLFAREFGAIEIFDSLIVANQVIDVRKGQFDDWIPDSTVKSARALASKVTTRIASLRDFDAKSSDVAIVQAVLAFCDYYSRATLSSCSVSMSWTTPDFWFPVRVPASNYGLFVAAAGNEGGGANTLYTLKRQLAARSATPPGDILAVMNVDARGEPTCESTTFGMSMSGIFGVSFSGFVDEATCGTSFAAPRVAWLLSAREAMRPAPQDTLKWRNSLWKEITTSVDESASGYNRYRLQINNIFKN